MAAPARKFHWTPVERPVIGMVHLSPLPESPRYDGNWSAVQARALADAAALVEGGVQALMIENFGDVPFEPGSVSSATVAHLTAIAARIRDRYGIPLGINVLRNDGLSALAVAQATGAQFIRVNILHGARLTDQGIIQGIAHDLLRARAARRAHDIRILADVNVKHSAALVHRSVAEEVHDLIERAGADAVIVTGHGTGLAADVAELQAVRRAAHSVPVLIGSGVTADGLGQYWPNADGFIVGTSLKQDGRSTSPVDRVRVQALMQRWKTLSESSAAGRP